MLSRQGKFVGCDLEGLAAQEYKSTSNFHQPTLFQPSHQLDHVRPGRADYPSAEAGFPNRPDEFTITASRRLSKLAISQ